MNETMPEGHRQQRVLLALSLAHRSHIAGISEEYLTLSVHDEYQRLMAEIRYYGMDIIFHLGKPLAMRLLHKAPRTVQTQAR